MIHSTDGVAILGDLHSVRATVDTIPGLVYTTTPDGAVEVINRRIIQYRGKDVAELKDWRSADFVHPDDLPRVLDSWRRAVDEGDLPELEQRLRRADGIYRWFQNSAFRLRDAHGRTVRWCGLLIDVDDRRRAEESLQEMQARLSRAAQLATIGKLAASIVHEVNQPLAAVSANGSACLRWLTMEPRNLSKAKQAAERVVRDAADAVEVVRRVRALFTRGPTCKLALNLNEVIREVLRLTNGEAAVRGVTLEASLAPEVPAVVGDRVQLQQLLLNLVLNALEAMEFSVDRPRTVELRSERQPDGVLVTVRDHGIGLSDPERAFEPFYTTKENGMGMGLPICRSIVEQHKGRLWATPAPGRGTTFFVALPVFDG